MTIASVQQAAAFGDHNIQYQFRTEGGQVSDTTCGVDFCCFFFVTTHFRKTLNALDGIWAYSVWVRASVQQS